MCIVASLVVHYEPTCFGHISAGTQHLPVCGRLGEGKLRPALTYNCTCMQVSFGEMVGCDNADCRIEWFHFQCVGLTAPPKNKWCAPRTAHSSATAFVWRS